MFIFSPACNFSIAFTVREKKQNYGDAFSKSSSIDIVFQYSTIKIEPVHETSNIVVCATSKASDQPVHTRSLIRAFAGRLSIL